MTSHKARRTANTLSATYAPENAEQTDMLSTAGSVRSKAPSNLGADLVSKFDEKRKAKYQLLREL